MGLDLDDLKIYSLLITVCEPYAVEPSMSVESEQFFRQMLALYEGDTEKEAMATWLDEQIAKSFRAIAESPSWIQGSAWQFFDGKPMLFVGQVDISLKSTPTAKEHFHDDTSFYVFIDGKGNSSVVMQQF
jgi:hypothetical protein